MGVAVLVHQLQDLFAGIPGGEHQGNLDHFARFQGQVPAQAEDRIQDKTLAVAELLEDPHADWRGSGRGR